MITEQEAAWAGDFGNAYNERSPGNETANYHLFAQALARTTRLTTGVRSILELGAGTGANIRPLAKLYPFDTTVTAIEINERAALKIEQTTKATVIRQSVLDWVPTQQYDLVLTKGLLIHIPPLNLPTLYDVIHAAARHYVLLCEYYNPTPVSIAYRGHEHLLWKRDFAGEMLDRFADLHLADYGFAYHRDAEAPQDDLTWFLLERR